MFSRPEAGKQSSSVSRPGSCIGTDDDRLTSMEVMQVIIFCVYIHYSAFSRIALTLEPLPKSLACLLQ